MQSSLFQPFARARMVARIKDRMADGERVRRKRFQGIDLDPFVAGERLRVDPIRVDEQQAGRDLRDRALEMERLIDRYGDHLVAGGEPTQLDDRLVVRPGRPADKDRAIYP